MGQAIGVRPTGAKWLLPIMLFGALALLPAAAAFGPQNYILSFGTKIMIFALAAMSLDLVLGGGGLISFGHASFIGIGAYAVGILSANGIGDLGLHALAAMACAALFALATGAISLRTQGVYFIMITLAFGQMLFFFATSLADYGGDDGLTIEARSRLFGHDWLSGERALYYVTLVVLLAAYLLCRRILGSRFGRVLRGTRDNAVRMEAIGFAPFRFRLVAYGIAGMLAALAGVLLANQANFVSPAYLAWQRSADLIFMIVIGGVGSLHGALIGALVFMLGEEILSGFTDHWRLVFGPLLVLFVIVGRGRLFKARHG